jgi:hypothetical protein
MHQWRQPKTHIEPADAAGVALQADKEATDHFERRLLKPSNARYIGLLVALWCVAKREICTRRAFCSYLFHPFALLSCAAQTTAVFDNFFAAVSMWATYNSVLKIRKHSQTSSTALQTTDGLVDWRFRSSSTALSIHSFWSCQWRCTIVTIRQRICPLLCSSHFSSDFNKKCAWRSVRRANDSKCSMGWLVSGVGVRRARQHSISAVNVWLYVSA